MDLAVRFWSGSTQMETNEAVDAVVPSLVAAYRDAGIEMPPEIRQIELGPASARGLERLAGERSRGDGDAARD